MITLQGIKPNSQPVRNKKKIEKIHAKEKEQSHAQDNIYVGRQFTYVHGVTGISLLSWKNTEYKLRLQYFLTLLKHGNRLYKIKTLITKSVSIWAKRIMDLGHKSSNRIKQNQTSQSLTNLNYEATVTWELKSTHTHLVLYSLSLCV